jgi:hypothetical protein
MLAKIKPFQINAVYFSTITRGLTSLRSSAFSEEDGYVGGWVGAWRHSGYGVPELPLDQCCPTFLCTRAKFTDAYGGAGATTLLLLLVLLLLLNTTISTTSTTTTTTTTNNNNNNNNKKQ